MLSNTFKRARSRGGEDTEASQDPTGTEADAGVDSDLLDEGEPAQETDPDLPLDVVFEILKNRRRRLVLKYLRDADGTTAIGDLAEHIAAIENEIDIQQLNSQQRKRVYIGLYQCHLPKMDDAGVIEFNQSRGIVELNENSEALYEYLEPTDAAEMEPVGEPFRPHAVLATLFGLTFAVAELTAVHMVSSVLVFCFFLLTLYLAIGSEPSPLSA